MPILQQRCCRGTAHLRHERCLKDPNIPRPSPPAVWRICSLKNLSKLQQENRLCCINLSLPWMFLPEALYTLSISMRMCIHPLTHVPVNFAMRSRVEQPFLSDCDLQHGVDHWPLFHRSTSSSKYSATRGLLGMTPLWSWTKKYQKPRCGRHHLKISLAQWIQRSKNLMMNMKMMMRRRRRMIEEDEHDGDDDDDIEGDDDDDDDVDDDMMTTFVCRLI